MHVAQQNCIFQTKFSVCPTFKRLSSQSNVSFFANVAVSVGLPHCWRNIAQINNYFIKPNYEEKNGGTESGGCEEMFLEEICKEFVEMSRSRGNNGRWKTGKKTTRKEKRKKPTT